jgi:formate hydrogenlyase subunit 3/multisubunit Na+/H+ antiporter MnhD subunit
MVIVLAIVVFGGYLFPLPGTAMAWREWLISQKSHQQKTWRHTITTLALLITTAGLPFWGYAVIRELRNDYSYIFASAQFGRYSSLLLVVICSFAEGQARIYLLIAVAGFLFFFACSIGELP